MTSLKNCRLFLLLLLCGFCIPISAQVTVHVITLSVDTEQFDPRNPSASCQFLAEEGTEVLVSDPPEEFTIAAEVGDIIRWYGVSSSQPETMIEIRKIKYEKGVNLFPFKEKDGDRALEATITKGQPGDDYKYVISFKIDATGAMYHIDPKIQVK